MKETGLNAYTFYEVDDENGTFNQIQEFKDIGYDNQGTPYYMINDNIVTYHLFFGVI